MGIDREGRTVDYKVLYAREEFCAGMDFRDFGGLKTE